VSQRLRLLCVDDHRVVREGLSAMLGRQPDMEVVALAATGEQAVELYRQHRPDVTLMDLQLPTMSGLEAIKAIRREFQDAQIIVLTMYHGEEDIFRALEAGAASYLLKDSISDDLTAMVREVAAGRRPIPPNIAEVLAARATQSTLSAREIQVVQLIAQGYRNKEIATELHITEETAKVHVRRVFAKLNVNDRTAAVRVALRRGIIHLD
jgi:two-component system NarL family response regulator